jgi:hypothetical protein
MAAYAALRAGLFSCRPSGAGCGADRSSLA